MLFDELAQHSGSGLDLRFRSTPGTEPEPQKRFGSPAPLDLDLHIGSGSGPNQVRKVRTSDRGQYIIYWMEESVSVHDSKGIDEEIIIVFKYCIIT